MSMRFLVGIVCGVTFMVSCSGMVVDRSMNAVEAGDYTLISSLCEATPNRGIDICHASEGTTIASEWKLFLPEHARIKGGEVVVYSRDIAKTFPIGGPMVNIPFSVFFNQTIWTRDLDGELLALATVRYETPEGIEELAHFRGIAKIVVTRPGYSRLPIDSGFVAFTKDVTCKIEYTTAGRSNFYCK